MAKYHINEKGKAGLCEAKNQCRFGGESGFDYHFPTLEEANKFIAFKEKLDNPQAKSFVSKSSDKSKLEQIQAGENLDKFLKDPNPLVRAELAKRGYRLDVLINDDDTDVLIAVAERGYGLEELKKDSHPDVRLMAKYVDSMGSEMEAVYESQLYMGSVNQEALKKAFPDGVAEGDFSDLIFSSVGGTYFRNSLFNNARFEGKFEQASFRDCDGDNIVFDNCGGSVALNESNFTNFTVAGGDYDSLKIQDSTVQEVKVSGSKIRVLAVEESDLRNSQLSNIKADYVRFHDARSQESTWENVSFKECGGFDRSNFSDSSFSLCDSNNAPVDITNSRFDNAVFSSCNMGLMTFRESSAKNLQSLDSMGTFAFNNSNLDNFRKDGNSHVSVNDCHASKLTLNGTGSVNFTDAFVDELVVEDHFSTTFKMFKTNVGKVKVVDRFEVGIHNLSWFDRKTKFRGMHQDGMWRHPTMQGKRNSTGHVRDWTMPDKPRW